MNARIKSLANIWANRRQEDPDLGVVYVFTEAALQVYSEKIVKECAERGSMAMYPDTDPDYVGRKIREHFGVKE